MKATVRLAATTADPILHVIDNVRGLLVGVLAALGVLALVYAGIRYVLAGGDPAAIERAKTAARSAVVGFVLALLAPVIIAVVRRVVTG